MGKLQQENEASRNRAGLLRQFPRETCHGFCFDFGFFGKYDRLRELHNKLAGRFSEWSTKDEEAVCCFHVTWKMGDPRKRSISLVGDTRERNSQVSIWRNMFQD